MYAVMEFYLSYTYYRSSLVEHIYIYINEIL